MWLMAWVWNSPCEPTLTLILVPLVLEKLLNSDCLSFLNIAGYSCHLLDYRQLPWLLKYSAVAEAVF